jgi:transcriptional regulator with XRE-family HTH domain
MTFHTPLDRSADLLELVRLERCGFAAKLRITRAVLGWSQSELAFRAGMTQRAIHKIEQGDTEPRRTTVFAIETMWRDYGLDFEDVAEGGFRVTVRAPLLEPNTKRTRRSRAARTNLGITAIRHRASA